MASRINPLPHPPETKARVGKKSMKMNHVLQSQAGGGSGTQGGDGDPILGKKSVLNHDTSQTRLLQYAVLLTVLKQAVCDF